MADDDHNHHNHNHNHHNHNHNHGCCGDEDGHDHELDGPEGEKYTLYQQIDLDHIICLNEEENGSAKKVFKPWVDRFTETPFVVSDSDEQLIIHIPFISSVKVKSIAVIGGPGDSTPSSMWGYANRDDLDFDSVNDIEPDQKWELIPPKRGNNLYFPEYRTKVAKFSNLRSLTLFFDKNFGDDITKISYIGLHGEYSEFTRDPIIAIYEAAANPADHKNKLLQSNFSAIQ